MHNAYRFGLALMVFGALMVVCAGIIAVVLILGNAFDFYYEPPMWLAVAGIVVTLVGGILSGVCFTIAERRR